MKRPAHMRVATFERLKQERAALLAEINREIGRRLASTKGGLLNQIALIAKFNL